MFYAFRLHNSGASSFLIDSAVSFAGSAGSRPAASHFLLLRQKKVTKEKATRSLGPYAGASGNLRCSKAAEFLETSQLRCRRTSKNLFPLPPALLSPARTGWGDKFGCGGSPHPNPLPQGEGGSPSSFPKPVPAGLEKAEGDGLKNLDVRRLRSRLVSKFSGSFSFFKEPRSGPGCGSPFFSLGFFGEAKKSKSPAGASPGMLARGTSIATTQRRRQEANK